MAAAIKRFFEKKKIELKFKKYGEGHKLTEDTRSKDAPKTSGPAVRPAMSESAVRAGEAALVRMTQPEKRTAGQASIKNQVRAELQAEMEAMDVSQKRAANNRQALIDASSHMSVQGVYYTSPLIGDEVLPKEELETKIHEYLLGQLAEVPEMASALMIHTLNKDREAVKTCIETICTYLQNILDNPEDEKFRKIRIGNKAFQVRVLALQGAEEFIQSAGFLQKKLPFQDSEADFYVLSDERGIEEVQGSRDLLLAAEPIKPELDRGLRVLDGKNPHLHVQHNDLPDAFFAVSKEELKRESDIRREAVESLGMLRTKAMRERDEQRELRRYRFALIRIRFPDNTILQGTFRASEKLTAILDYIRASLHDDWLPFSITGPTGHKLTDEARTVAELGLAPAAVVNLTFDESVTSDVMAARGAEKMTSYIKDEILALKQ